MSRIAVPEARDKINQLKEEAINELGITLNKDEHGNYRNNGDIPSRVAGAIGGRVVQKVIAAAERDMLK